MANDEQNRSGRGKPNQIGPGPSWLEQQGAQFQRRTAQDRAERLRYEQAGVLETTMEDALASGIGGREKEIVEHGLSGARKAMNSLGPRIELRAQTRQERFMTMAQSNIQRDFDPSTVNGQVARLSRTTFGQEQGLRHMGKSYSDIESAYQANVNRIGELGQGSMSLAERLYDVNGNVNQRIANRLGGKEAQRQNIEREMAGQYAAMGAQAKLGMDPRSQMSSLLASGQEARGMQTDAANKLTEALEKLTKGAEEGAKNLEDLKKAALDAEAGFKASGGGGGGGFDGTRLGKFASRATPWLEMSQQVLGAASQGFQQIGVNQSLAVKYNAAGLAGIENQKYDMYQKARGGDVASQLMLSQWAGAEGFGSNLKTAANISVAAGGASALSGAILSGLKGAAAGFGVGAAAGAVGLGVGAVPGAILGAVGGAAYGVVNATSSATDIARGVSGDQAKIAGINAQMEAARQIMAVPAAQMQGFRDFATGMGTAARGMGAGGSAFLKGGVNSLNLQRMGQEGISPEQMAMMSQMGQASMGSMFNREQVFGARSLERSGYGLAEENMQRYSALAAAGSNNPQAGLTSVLEAAFGKSLENAKTLTMLVENTAAMAGRSGVAAMGMDATGAAATFLTANLDPTQTNREFAMNRARNAAETANAIVTDDSMSFANMAALARVQSIPGMTGVGAIAANKLGIVDLKTIQDQAATNPEEAARALRKFGVPANASGVQDEVGRLLENAQLKILEKGGIPIGANSKAMLKSINSAGPLTMDEELLKGQIAALGGFAGGSDNMERSVLGVMAKNDPNAKLASETITSGKAGGKELKDADKLLTSGFSQLSEAAQAAAAQLGGAVKAMEKLVQLQDLANKEGGVKGETRMSGAAAVAAGSTMFSKGAETFSNAATKWDMIAEKLMKAGIGDRPTSSTPIPVSTGNSKTGTSPGG